jgi:hypothetical protein
MAPRFRDANGLPVSRSICGGWDISSCRCVSSSRVGHNPISSCNRLRTHRVRHRYCCSSRQTNDIHRISFVPRFGPSSRFFLFSTSPPLFLFFMATPSGLLELYCLAVTRPSIWARSVIIFRFRIGSGSKRRGRIVIIVVLRKAMVDYTSLRTSPPLSSFVQYQFYSTVEEERSIPQINKICCQC